MEKEQTQLVGDEGVYGSSHLLKLHVISKCLQDHGSTRC